MKAELADLTESSIDLSSYGMNAVTISPKYQVVIPQQVREALGLRVGEKVQVIPFRNRIELVPVREMRKYRGMAKGTDTTLPRDDDRL